VSEQEAADLAAAQRRGDPFLVWRDAHGRQVILSLRDGWERITIGRGAAADVSLPWDSEVSRVHTELLRLGDDWAAVDNGISRNGTFVNAEPIERRRRLLDGDELRVGDTVLGFHAPFQIGDETVVAEPTDPASSGEADTP
jgi:pSer/pThr/pTyr-binding forkhead associated (FHA) protein